MPTPAKIQQAIDNAELFLRDLVSVLFWLLVAAFSVGFFVLMVYSILAADYSILDK